MKACGLQGDICRLPRLAGGRQVSEAAVRASSWCVGTRVLDEGA